MSDKSRIEWTDATWGPTVGCTKVSPGCDHCYAETFVNRFAGKSPAFPNRFDTVTLRPQFLDLPFRWKRPRRIFVNSLSDLFHADVPDEYIAQVFGVMAATRRHTYQILTKRHARMRALLNSGEFFSLVGDHAIEACGLDGIPWPLPNVWGGVSVEDQRWAEVRIPALLDTPLAVRFLSCEPLLGPVNLSGRLLTRDEFDRGIDWVIAGGESGPGARPMHRDWARALRDQCEAAGVAFHFKQWGQHDENGVRRRSKHDAGRELDGRTHDGYPDVAIAAGPAA